MAAKICASIAAENAQLMKEQAHNALSSGADFVELRFDYLRPELLEEAVKVVRDLKGMAVYTLRSKEQGGKFGGSEHERIQWLMKIAKEGPMLIDIELDSLRNNDELADFLENLKTSILVSWHDFNRTPPSEEIADILSEMRVYSNYVKIVTMAHSTEDSLTLLSMYENTTGLHPIIFAMGEPGVLSRVLCTVVGNAPFTYATLENAIAPGQLTVKQLRKLYDRLADIRA
ncbi:MAG: type I 3-dehydroquinate dehydratase [Nitrososphaera sp.]